jgi:hypothetical protein
MNAWKNQILANMAAFRGLVSIWKAIIATIPSFLFKPLWLSSNFGRLCVA